MTEIKKPAEAAAQKTVEAPKKAEAPAAKKVEAPAMKKTEAPKAAKAPAAKKEAAPKAAKAPAAKKAAAPKAEKAASKKGVKVKVVVEHHGRQITTDTITKTAEKLWTLAGHDASKIATVDLYVKQEDGAVYCVVNGEPVGKYDL